MRKAIVVNENILGLLVEGPFLYVEVLRASVLRGASTSQLFTLPITATDYRPATKKDFENFNVLYHREWEVAE